MIFEISVIIGSLLAIASASIFCLRQWLHKRKKKLHGTDSNQVYFGIFHPYCNAGGGGERVLWCTIRALQNKYDNIKIIVYTGDVESSPSAIFAKTKATFNICLENEKISFVYLKHRDWIEAKKYPYFTLLGQSVGSMFLGLEALWKFPPDIFFDTMGYAFTFPLFRFLIRSKIGCYVHYPIISTDMLNRVHFRQMSHNNQVYIARNPLLTWMKIVYYQLFSKLYKWAGQFADIIMVNSTWTENHILELWEAPYKTYRVYPPCEVNNLKSLKHLENRDEIVILSVGQFRPEKNHPLQLQALYELRTLLSQNENIWDKIRLIIVGSCRNNEDYERLKNMQDLSKHLSLENSIEFRVNVSYDELMNLYQTAQIGLHTMWNEHFGIGIVESMAAGLVMIAHRSGGPMLDIIETSEGSQNGFLATEPIEYANCMLSIIKNSAKSNEAIITAARSSVERFSDKEFEINFLRAVSPILTKIS